MSFPRSLRGRENTICCGLYAINNNICPISNMSHLQPAALPVILARMTHVHLIKLSVGTETVDDLIAWQATKRAQAPDGCPRHVTRMWPRREAEVLNGGSIFWVIKGVIQCRQVIKRLDEYIGSDGIRRCAIVLEPEIIRTQTSLKRPFQGWRYLQPADAPPDLPEGRDHEEPLPVELNKALAEIGVL